jgi:subtilisin-like proprotein convertase family protein
MYTGSSITIDDNSASSGTISISDMREIQNIELFVNKLKHQHPQDLAFVLVTPNQDKILLSAHNKILNNNIVNGFNFVISNKAVPGTYINNVANIPYQIPYVNILDKRSSYNFNNETLLADFDHLIGTSPSGDWTLIIKDDDIGTSGSISDWGLVIAYKPPPFTIDEI